MTHRCSGKVSVTVCLPVRLPVPLRFVVTPTDRDKHRERDITDRYRYSIMCVGKLPAGIL